MKVNLLLAVLLCSIAFTNCNKEKESQINTLTSRPWKRAWTDLNPATNPQGPILYYAVLNCEKDDTFTFNEGGTLIIDRNTDKCVQNEPEISNQSYLLNPQTKELVLDGSAYILAEVSSKQIKYFKVVPTTNGFQSLMFLLQ